MICRQTGKMGAKAVVLLAILWLCPLSIMAYPELLTLNDAQVSSSNLSMEDSILKHYAEILQQMALRVPTKDPSNKKQATTISSDREKKIKETTMAIPGEILDEIPEFLTSDSSTKTKPEVPLIKETAWSKEKLESSIRHPREQEEKEQEKVVNTATEEVPGNTENTDEDLDDSDMEDDDKVLETDESDTEEDIPEEPAEKKNLVSTLELAVKLARNPTQKPKPVVKEANKQAPKVSIRVRQKSPLDSALKLIEEASQQVKKHSEKPVMARLSPSAMDLVTRMSQPSKEAKDQLKKAQVVENQILKKISDLNAEIKHALKNAKHHIEFKDNIESAKKIIIQSLSLLEGENTSSKGHKSRKLTREKVNDENIRLFINLLYEFKSQLTVFLNMNNIPSDLQGKATTVFKIMKEMLCGYQQKGENVMKRLLQDNMRMLNMLNNTKNHD